MTLLNTPSHNGSWFALLSTTFSCFIIVTGEFLAIGVLNSIAEDFQISTGTAGLTVTVTSIAGMASALLIPIYARSMDRHHLLLYLVGVMIIANVITAFFMNFGMILLGRFLLGIALGGFWGISSGLVTRLAPKHLSTAMAVSIFFFSVTLVTVLGVPLGAWLSTLFGWRFPFFMLAILGLIALLIQFIVLPPLKPSSSLKWRELLLLPKSSIARKGLILFILIFLAHFAAYSYFTAFFKQSIGFSDNQISVLLLSFGIATVLGNFLAGYIGKYNVRYSFAFMALLLTFTFFAFATLPISLIGALLLAFIWGAAAGMVPATINIWMHIHVPHLIEKGAALLTFLFFLLITLGSFMGGIMMDNFTGMILMGSLSVLTLFALLLVFTLTRGIKNRVISEGV